MALKNIKWPDRSGGDDSRQPNSSPSGSNAGKTKWRTIVGLLLMYVAVALNWQWIWGVLSLYWILPGLFVGVTYFIEPIDRRENPILFWIIAITWIAFSLVMFFPVGG
ncbi:MAG: hypothetical protein MJA27_28025 [Pseudanabaenales cyanobacterium]|nr:hypothetical protein [Pseudanabaenales cyanobacterium]